MTALYSIEFDRYFTDEDDLEDWINDFNHDIGEAGPHLKAEDMGLVVCKEVYLHETFHIEDVVNDDYYEKFEDADIKPEALKELKAFFKDWSIRHGLAWNEPTSEKYLVTTP